MPLFLKRVSENSHSMVGAEVTRLQMLWKSPGLAAEEVSLLTSAPTFQTSLRRGIQFGRWRHLVSKAEILPDGVNLAARVALVDIDQRTFAFFVEVGRHL
jgi:hypothetical protein